MKISQEIRQLKNSEQEENPNNQDINQAMEQKSKEFLQSGAEIYIEQKNVSLDSNKEK